MRISNRVVCILTAGVGSRMGPMSRVLNKSLFVFKKKAIISNIIEKFPKKNTKFIIGLGYKGNQVKSFLKIAHPDIDFVFKTIKNYKGKGSGPGLSLYSCKKYLQKPFYFISCDTYIRDKVPLNIKNNWIGTNKKRVKNNENYCNVKVKKNEIIKVRDKVKTNSQDFYQFIGICYIKNYKDFWLGLLNKKLIKNELQISNGLKNLILNKKTLSVHFNWLDLGNYDDYKKSILKNEKYDFSKTNECIYFYKNKIIKFFSDKKIIKNRIKKIKNKKNIFPTIKESSKEFYSYGFFKGKIFYKNLDIKIFKLFLNFSINYLWKIKKIYSDRRFVKICNNFYKEKTFKRYSIFQKKYPDLNENKKLNGKKYGSIDKVLSKINWNIVNNGIQSYIHGDLQFDNVIYNKKLKKFKLIDWRQDFGKSLMVGDLYYDLAKIYGGMLINYSEIKKNNFYFYESKSDVFFRAPKIKNINKFKKIFFDMIISKGMEVKKVKILTGLIYLNMAPLHQHPFDKLLFNYSKIILNEELN